MNIILKSCIKKKFSSFQKCQQHFLKNYQTYEKPIFSSGGNQFYTSIFARTTLIMRDQLDMDMVFRKIKDSILLEQKKLSPRSCSNIMQTLRYFLFQGDENAVLNRLIEYFEKNEYYFSKKEKLKFEQNYMDIMINKAHSSVKFRPLKTKKLQNKTQKFYNLPSLNIYQKIKNINIISQKQFFFQIKLRKQQTIKVNVIGIDQIKNNEEALKQIYLISSKMKKRDCIFMHSNRIQKVKGLIKYQNIIPLYNDRNYFRKMYFYDRPKNQHQISQISRWMTILLRLPQDMINEKMIVMNYVQDYKKLQVLGKYINPVMLKQSFGQACLLNFHETLYHKYLKQYYINEGKKDKKKRQELTKQQYEKYKLKNQNKKLYFYKQKRHSPFQLVFGQNIYGKRFSQSQSILQFLQQYQHSFNKVLIVLDSKQFHNFIPPLLQAHYLTQKPYTINQQKLSIISSLKDWQISEQEINYSLQRRNYYKNLLYDYELY